MKLVFGDSEFRLGGAYLNDDLRDCNAILADAEALQCRMQQDGYLLVRGLHDRKQVLQARSVVLNELADRGMLAPGSAVEEAIFNAHYLASASTSAVSNERLAQSGVIDSIVSGSAVHDIFSRLLASPATSFDYRWLRTAGTGACSPIHCDHVFMGRGSKNLYTCWTPLCDVTFNMGPLVLCLGSHKKTTITNSYGQADVDRDLIAGHFSDQPAELVDRFGCRWATTEFQAGDVIVFNMHMLHASLTNTSDHVRISIDTRYQPASEAMDQRWSGQNPLGHYAWKAADAKIEPLNVSRRRWGLD